MVGISQSTVSRMELGRGACFPLRVWARVAAVIGLELAANSDGPKGFGLPSIVGLASAGGWIATPHPPLGTGVVRLHRAPRSHRRFGRPVMTQGECAIVQVADVVTDVASLTEGLRQIIKQEERIAPPGWRVGGLLVVRRTTANRRRVTECRAILHAASPGSGSDWIGSMRSADSPMPRRTGLVWMESRATRLIPTGLRVRGG